MDRPEANIGGCLMLSAAFVGAMAASEIATASVDEDQPAALVRAPTASSAPTQLGTMSPPLNQPTARLTAMMLAYFCGRELLIVRNHGGGGKNFRGRQAGPGL